MTRKKSFLIALIVGAVLAASCGDNTAKPRTENKDGSPASQTVEVTRVVSQTLNVTLRLPGELKPFEAVAIYPKVTGFVKSISVDRGSHVKAGQFLIRLEAPELLSQTAEAQAKVQGANSQLAAAEAKLAADENTYQNLKAASATPGVVAGNDLVLAQKAAEGDRAQVKVVQENVNAAKQALRSITEIQDYLSVKAPFDGVVTERNVHPGALVGPSGGPGTTSPMIRMETISRLRLVVPVPETYVAGIPEGTTVHFTVPSFPGQSFTGKVTRIAHDVEVQTRTMPVELDVTNPSGRLSPGTFCEVQWPLRRPGPTLFVPTGAIGRTLQRVFVVRIRNGQAEWTDVKAGVNDGNLTEVFGDLREGDLVATRGTDELKPGTKVNSQEISQSVR